MDWATLRLRWEPRMLSILRIVVGPAFSGARYAENFQFSAETSMPTAFQLFTLGAGACRCLGVGRRYSYHDWPVHPTRGVHFVGRDGLCLFHVPCAARVLSDKHGRQWGELAIVYCFTFLYFFLSAPASGASTTCRNCELTQGGESRCELVEGLAAAIAAGRCHGIQGAEDIEAKRESWLRWWRHTRIRYSERQWFDTVDRGVIAPGQHVWSRSGGNGACATAPRHRADRPRRRAERPRIRKPGQSPGLAHQDASSSQDSVAPLAPAPRAGHYSAPGMLPAALVPCCWREPSVFCNIPSEASPSNFSSIG